MSRMMVRVQDVGKAFHTVRAVDSVSFQVNAGEIFALLGPNGAGKSTLIRMMLGMLTPDQGSIQWFNDHQQPIPLNPSDIGYLPEDRGLYRCQTVKDILVYFGELRGMSRSAARGAAEEWATRLEVDQYLNARLETLSKGNQQRVQVASAVLHRPRLALLDEPFSGLDPLNQEMMLGVIQSLRDEGTTVLLSAHQLNLVEQLADRVFLLAQGKRVLEGSVYAVKSGVHGGYSLQITFANPIDADFLEAWENHPELTGFERKNNGIVQLTLRHQSASIEWIERAMQLGEIAEFRGGTLSLHEIYLRALNPRSGSKKPALVSV